MENDFFNCINIHHKQNDNSTSFFFITNRISSLCLLLFHRVIYCFKHKFHYPTNFYLFEQFKNIEPLNTQDLESIKKISDQFRKVCSANSSITSQSIDEVVKQAEDRIAYENWKNECTDMMKNGRLSIEHLDNSKKNGFLTQINHLGYTLFHWISLYMEHCEDSLLLYLLDHQVNLSALDHRGNTALHSAIANANFGTALQFIKLDQCDLQQKDRYSKTPLHFAILKGYKDRDSTGKKLSCSSLDLVRELIERHADVNAVDELGNTPLHYAALRRDIPTIKLLLEASAKLDVKNKNKESPTDLLGKNDYDARQLLKQLVLYYFFDQKERTESLSEAKNLLVAKILDN